MDTNAKKLTVMARMQDGYNKEVHVDWRTQGYEYYRAIWVECAELLDHFGWKWWKHQECDIEQVRLEIVDIWHFGLSEMIRADLLSDAVLPPLCTVPAERPDLRRAVEALAADVLASRGFAVQPFADLMHALPMTFDELFDLYVGKNVLNSFRLAHGYKTGSYQKIWAGREDNEHLIEVFRSLECDPEQVPDAVYTGLEARYPA